MKKADVVNWKVPVPFAFGSGEHLYRMGTEASGLTYARGFSQNYSSEAGQKVALGDVNGMFNMATFAAYFNQRGGWRTFSKEVSDAIGGYPEGAILYWYDESTGKLRTVRSMKGDNADDFVEDPELIDGTSWKFVDAVPVSSLRVRMYAGRPSAIANATSDSPWTAPFDCVIVTGLAEVTGRAAGAEAVSVFIQVKNSDDEGFGTAGMLSVSIPPVLAAQSWWNNSNAMYGTMGVQKTNPISDYGSRAVAYVAKGGIVQPMSSNGASATVQFTYYPLEF